MAPGAPAECMVLATGPVLEKAKAGNVHVQGRFRRESGLFFSAAAVEHSSAPVWVATPHHGSPSPGNPERFTTGQGDIGRSQDLLCREQELPAV